MNWNRIESLSEMNKTQLVFLVIDRDNKIKELKKDDHTQENMELINSNKKQHESLNAQLQEIKNYQTNEKLRELKIADMAIEIKSLYVQKQNWEDFKNPDWGKNNALKIDYQKKIDEIKALNKEDVRMTMLHGKQRKEIESLKEEIHKLKHPPVPLHKKPLHDILMKFLEDKCELKDNVGPLAPTNFMDIFFDFRAWAEEMDLAGRVKGHDSKKLIKGFMMEAQDNSKYGLEIGGTMKDGCKNGSARNLYVNFVCKDED